MVTRLLARLAGATISRMEAYQKSFAMLCPCTVELRYAAGIATAKQIKLYQANVLFTSEHI